VAILFSIADSARADEERLYITRYTGTGSLAAMLNAKMSSEEFQPYASLISTMLHLTRARKYLSKASVSNSLVWANTRIAQVAVTDVVWLAVRRIFPEVFDGTIRAEMIDLRCLPRWAAEE
jgi:hypothetical protein